MPIVFVPGIKGTELVDTYPLPFEVRWSLEDMLIGNVFEDEQDLRLRDGRFDQDLHLFREWQPIGYAYGTMLKRLRKHDAHCYVFAYDWRRRIEDSAVRLVEFMEHIQQKHSHAQHESPLDFVTHSMGGLVLRSALRLRPNFPVSRIVFIAPPFRGAADICKVLISGEKSGWFSDNEGFRKLARSFPSIYQLIPSYDSALVRSPSGSSLNPFQLKNWQKNVTSRGKGFDPSFLANAEAFVRADGAQLSGKSDAPMLEEKTLAKRYGNRAITIIGTGHKTTWQIPVLSNNTANPNWFDFDRTRTDVLGDGRVHLKSCGIRGMTLAAFDTRLDHGRVCRESVIVDAVEMWLSRGKLLKMRRRTRRNSVKRPSKAYFPIWNGDETTFRLHRVIT